MLLTLTYEGKNTQELGFLLRKNPYRAQRFELNFGDAYIFYPEVTDERTTMALLLDINPIDLARGKPDSAEGGLFDYVNDRPYAATSFLCTAISRLLGTAMNGSGGKMQALADSKLRLTARVYMLPCPDDGFARDMFEPLGYTVETVRHALDPRFPEWGLSPYVDLTVSGEVRLGELLRHLYVLIPVFDSRKHYYYSSDEIDKLLSHGDGWLETHPSRDRIVYRYFKMRKSFARLAIDRLIEGGQAEDGSDDEDAEGKNGELVGRAVPLNEERLTAVRDAVKASGASSVIDFGCGGGKLEKLLLSERQLTRIAACDVSVRALEQAKERLRYDEMSESAKKRLTLMQGSLTYRDERFEGFDCACAVEVIEHIDPARLPSAVRVIFEFAKPKTVIITTPNSEYNVKYENLGGEMRHTDHRFEWTREEFRRFCDGVCARFGYTVKISGIGSSDETCGEPTQMGVFTKCV